MMNSLAIDTDNPSSHYEATLVHLGVNQTKLPDDFNPMYTAMDECGA